jgi:Fe-S cluster assembly iron-binding protein IscA
MKIRVTEKASAEIKKSMSQKISDVRILVKGFG